MNNQTVKATIQSVTHFMSVFVMQDASSAKDQEDVQEKRKSNPIQFESFTYNILKMLTSQTELCGDSLQSDFTARDSWGI